MDYLMEQIRASEDNIAYLYGRIVQISDWRYGFMDISNYASAHMQIEELRRQINVENSKIKQLRSEFYGQSR